VSRTPAIIEIIECDPMARRRLARLLRHARYRVVTVADAEAALRRPSRRPLDVAIVALADRGALSTLAELRARIPAVIALARPAVVDVVDALDAGADDYLAQPADPDELLARLRAVLRRHRTDPFPVVVVTADFTVDLTERRLVRAGQEVHLTPIEWRIVEYLVSHPDRLLSHEQILRQVWGPAKDDKVVYLRVYLAALRRKLEPDPAAPRYFITEPGYGFRFRPGGTDRG
jgi:two-component system KDP operon response regulator KdpE